MLVVFFSLGGGGYIPYMEPMGVESYKFVTCSCLKDATEAMACCMKNDSFSTFQVWDCFFFFFSELGVLGVTWFKADYLTHYLFSRGNSCCLPNMPLGGSFKHYWRA